MDNGKREHLYSVSQVAPEYFRLLEAEHLRLARRVGWLRLKTIRQSAGAMRDADAAMPMLGITNFHEVVEPVLQASVVPERPLFPSEDVLGM